MGFDVFSDSLKNIDLNSSRAKTLNTISPNSYGISSFDLEFRRSLMDSDYLVLDGVYFSLASIILSGRNITKNQGPDVFRFFMQI